MLRFGRHVKTSLPPSVLVVLQLATGGGSPSSHGFEGAEPAVLLREDSGGDPIVHFLLAFPVVGEANRKSDRCFKSMGGELSKPEGEDRLGIKAERNLLLYILKGNGAIWSREGEPGTCPKPCLPMMTADLSLCRDQKQGSEVDATVHARQDDTCPSRAVELA